MSTTGASKKRFFIIGPLRTGSSLMSRCIDDHPAAICLCESEINRALFRDYFLELHFSRMVAHGLTLEDSIRLINKKKQDDIASLFRWYDEVLPVLGGLYGKEDKPLLGDKSPDFYRSQELIECLGASHKLIYTVRDPRAILASIEVQTDADEQEKAERWGFLIENYRAWKPYLGASNVLAVRYEDLVANPEATMRSVYSHLGLSYSSRFLEEFPRPYPQRFLWTTAIDLKTGVRKDFDLSRISSWKKTLTEKHLDRVKSDPAISEFMDRFGYGD